MQSHTSTSSKRSRWLGLLFISVSLLIISLDNTILNVALPSISTSLGATASQLQWVVDSYVLVFAALLLTMGSLGDKHGRKRALQFGIIWFAVFSFIAANSTSTEMLIVARGFLGVGGALIMPATLSLITAMFRDPKERAQAIAMWAAVFGLGVGIGPLIGGFLLEHFDWSAVFYVNLPVAAVALVGGYFFLPESRDEDAPPADWVGVGLSIVGLFLLVYGIIEAGPKGWTATEVLVSLAASAVVLTVFAWWEGRHENAMLPLYLFRNPSFTGANVAMTLVMFGMFGIFFFFSQFLQSVEGYSPLETGWRLLPMAFAVMISAGISAKVSLKLGTKITVGMGFLIGAAGMFYLSQTSEPGMAYSTLILGLMIVGAGMGIAMSPATNSIMGSTPVDKAGVGSAMNDTTRQVGGALGVAVLGTVLNDVYLDQIASLKDTLAQMANMQAQLGVSGASDLTAEKAFEGVSRGIQGAHMVAERISQTAGPLGQRVYTEIISVADAAFVDGMTQAMVVAGVVLLVAGLFVFAVLPSRVRCMGEGCAEAERLPEGEAVALAAD